MGNSKRVRTAELGSDFLVFFPARYHCTVCLERRKEKNPPAPNFFLNWSMLHGRLL